MPGHLGACCKILQSRPTEVAMITALFPACTKVLCLFASAAVPQAQPGAQSPGSALQIKSNGHARSAPPLIVSASWNREIDKAAANLGLSVASAGDVNGDGFGDVIAGAPYFTDSGKGQGRAFVFHGSASGLDTAIAWIGLSRSGATLSQPTYGRSVAGAGDINGDGFDDVIVGEPGYSNGEAAEGRVHMYLGSPTGLSTSASWIYESNAPNANLGTVVAGAGDVNGDGFADIVIAARGFSDGDPGEGGLFLFLGSASGLANSPDRVIQSDQTGAALGFSLAGVGDVDGDGFDDILASQFQDLNGAPRPTAMLFRGSTGGLGASADAVLSLTLTATGAFSNILQVTGLGDLNGDGFDDVALSATAETTPTGGALAGRVMVYLGSASGLPSTPSWTRDGEQPNLGLDAYGAGDLDGDGFADLVLGALGYDGSFQDEGRVEVFLGSASGLGSQPAWSAYSGQMNAGYGIAAGAGDVDLDGFGDLIVGAYRYDGGQLDEGSIFLYRGFDMPLASGQSYNGSGSNAACFLSEPAVLGASWDSSILASARPGATLAAILVHALPSVGGMLPGGEVLVDLNSTEFAILMAPVQGTLVSLGLQVPLDPYLAGTTATAQGLLIGGAGYTLCNGYQFVVGF